MDSTGFIYKSKWREKGNEKDGKDHAEMLNYNKIKAPDVMIYGFIQGGAPCGNCTEYFKKQAIGDTGFVFIVEKGKKGKSQGGTGYPILESTIIADNTDFFPPENISGDKVIKSTPLTTDSLPAIITFWEGNCYFGGAPEISKITSKIIEELKSYASK